YRICDHSPNFDFIKCGHDIDKGGVISLQGDLVVLDEDAPHEELLLEDHHYCSPAQRHNGPRSTISTSPAWMVGSIAMPVIRTKNVAAGCTMRLSSCKRGSR